MYRPHRSSIKYLAILSVVLVGTSCERILDKDPIGILDAGSFFQTEQDALQAVNAAYQPLTFSNTNIIFTGLLESWREMKPSQEEMAPGQVWSNSML